MTIVRLLLLVAISLVLEGCASIDKTMASWTGRHQSELIGSWGPPQQVFSDGNGGSVLVYTTTRSYTSPGTATTTVTGSAQTFGNTTYGNATARTTYTPAYTSSYESSRTFWVDANGRIYRWAWKGI